MPVDYKEGKIYKLTSEHTEKIYIGSTTQKYLSSRLSTHKGQYTRCENKTNSKYLFELGDVKIELLECFPCNSKDELHARERHWINLNRQQSINIRLPGRTKEQYLIDERENINTRKKQYREENANAISDKGKRYYQENSEKIKERQNAYRKANLEKINASKRERYAQKKLYD